MTAVGLPGTADRTAVELPADRTAAVTSPAWVTVCRLADLVRERGSAALVGADQVALFRLLDDTVLAVQQRDPYTGANVMSRGIVGSRGDRPTVASPLHKQVFDLRTGECLEPVGEPPRHLRTWPVRCEAGTVLVGSGPAPGAPVDPTADRAGRRPPSWGST